MVSEIFSVKTSSHKTLRQVVTFVVVLPLFRGEGEAKKTHSQLFDEQLPRSLPGYSPTSHAQKFHRHWYSHI